MAPSRQQLGRRNEGPRFDNEEYVAKAGADIRREPSAQVTEPVST